MGSRGKAGISSQPTRKVIRNIRASYDLSQCHSHYPNARTRKLRPLIFPARKRSNALFASARFTAT